MKKILALVFSLGALTTVFGQGPYSKDDREGSRDMAYRRHGDNDGSYNRGYSRNDNRFTARERDALIYRINREFDFKVMSVKRDHRLRNGEKKRAIRSLERARKEEIKKVIWRYEHQNDRYHRDRDRNDRRYH